MAQHENLLVRDLLFGWSAVPNAAMKRECELRLMLTWNGRRGDQDLPSVRLNRTHKIIGLGPMCHLSL